MKIRFPLPALLLSILLPICGVAGAAVIQCNQCSDMAYQTKARQAGLGDHIVFDMMRGLVQTFEVDCSGVSPERAEPTRPVEAAAARSRGNTDQNAATVSAGCSRPAVTLIPTDPAIQDQFDRELAFFRLAGNKNTMEVVINMDEVDFTEVYFRNLSAFDVVSSLNARARLMDWVASGHDVPLSSAVSATIQALVRDLAGAFVNGDLKVVIKVVFSDGTSIDLIWDMSTNTLEPVANSARADGNLIPENPLHNYGAQGQYDFSRPDSARRYVEWLISQGVPVEYQHGRLRMQCTWDGRELRCHFTLGS